MQNNILAWISSLLLGIGVVWHFIDKYKAKVRKAVKVAHESLEMIDDILDAIEDHKITTEEIEKIAKDAEKLKAALEGV